MTVQKASPAARFVGWAAALTAALLVVFVVLHLAGRRERLARPAADKPALADGPVDSKEKVWHREYLGGRLAAEIRTDRYFQGPDGRRHLEGRVEVTDFGPDGAVLSTIAADSIAYDGALSRFEISGRVKVAIEDMILQGSYFEYDKERGVFETRRGGFFSSAGMAGEAAAVSYEGGREEAFLSGGFRIVIGSDEPAAERSVLTGDALRFLRRSGSGQAAGPARFVHGPVEGTAESLSFALAPGELSFGSVAFSGSAKILLAGNDGNISERRALEADEVDILFSSGAGRVERVEARGNCRLSLVPEGGGRALLSAAAAVMGLGVKGEVLSWSASGGFRLELGDQAGRARTVEGERASGDGGMRSLAAAPGAGQAVVLDSERLRIEAASLDLKNGGGDFAASGGVRCQIKPDEEAATPGFFSRESPIFISAGSMERRGDSGGSRFKVSVRAWQGARRVAAEALDVDERAGSIQARGRVEVALPGPLKKGVLGDPVEAGGEEMGFSPGDRSLRFRGNSFIRMPGARLAAEEIVASLGEGGLQLERLTAKTGIVVSRGRYEGRGQEARYDAASDTIELVGRPVLFDQEGRASRGSKLTFDLSDGRIRLENEGKGRSITIVKS